MPTVEEPKQQQPMEAVPSQQQGTGRVPGNVITQQPRSEPRPQPENDVSMRGGSLFFSDSCRCCGFTCSCNRRIC
ncbi:hypothetical protein VTK56DRAFT_569 [Thermocarpiscus australiensis]